MLLYCVSAGNRLADWTVTRYKKTHITVQDNIETAHLATGAPVSACIVLINNDNIFLNQK